MVHLEPQAWFQWMQAGGGCQGDSFVRSNKDFISLDGNQLDVRAEEMHTNNWLLKCEQVFREVTYVVKRQLVF